MEPLGFAMRMVALAACLAVSVILPSPSFGDDDTPRERRLVIGKVSENPRKHFWYLKPIADYAAGHLADLGIEEAGVLMAKDNATMVRYLKNGEVDWVTETPFSALVFAEEADAQIILSRHKKGMATYRPLFFSRRDSGIEELTDLEGRRIALEDPGSTSAYLLPLLILLEHGLRPALLPSPRDAPPEGAVGYCFAGQEINISTWVYEKRVAAGAFNEHDWRKNDHTPPAYRKQMHILHRGAPHVRALELVRPGLAPALRERLVDVLLKAHEDPRARRALKAYQETTRFDAVDEETRTNLGRLKQRMRETLGKSEEGE